MPMPNRLACLTCLALGLCATLPAQEAATPAPRDEPHFIVREWPRDKREPIAVVGQQTLTLEDLVLHIDSRHYDGFAKLLETQPTFQAYLTSDLMAPWVRHFADLEALKQHARQEGDYIDLQQLERMQSQQLKSSFEQFLETYTNTQRAQGRSGELSEKKIAFLLRDFQLRHGLACELQGMLDLLEPKDYTRPVLRDFFNANARFFGGQVTVAHILVQHRDGGTGLLLDEEGRKRANDRIAEIKASLREDGSNFAQIARLYSDDRRTADTGGLLPGLRRFDDRMPATICRAAWRLRDGDMTQDVVESQYGYHFLQRVEFHQNIFMLFNDDAMPSIKIVMQRAMQEQRLFAAREKTGLRLLL